MDTFGCASHAFAIAVRVYVYSRVLGAKHADALGEADAIAKVHATAPGECGSEGDGCVGASSVRRWAHIRKNLTELQFPVFP